MTLLYYRLERAGVPLPLPVRDVRLTHVETPRDELPVDARRAFVDRVDLFAPLPETVKELIASSLESITFASGEPIVKQGDEGDSMFFVQHGGVRIVLEQEGLRKEVSTLEAGQYFGEMSLLTGEPRTATALAVGDVDAFLLHKDAFKRILENNPYVLRQISTVMTERRSALADTEEALAKQRTGPQEKDQSFLEKVNRFFGLS
jgi:CRP-like cAMP-binding protein